MCPLGRGMVPIARSFMCGLQIADRMAFRSDYVVGAAISARIAHGLHHIHRHRETEFDIVVRVRILPNGNRAYEAWCDCEGTKEASTETI
mgnify:CR=1 FL=1